MNGHKINQVPQLAPAGRGHNPQYNREALERSLRDAGIGYEHMKALGGLRHPRKDSPNMGWRNESFRGYADYMQTTEFESVLNVLDKAAAHEAIAIMCAEAVPWRCHRSLISDALTARGYRVEHIMTATESNPHTMTPFARVEGTSIVYPASGQENLFSSSRTARSEFGQQADIWGVIGPPSCILPERFGLLSESATIHSGC